MTTKQKIAVPLPRMPYPCKVTRFGAINLYMPSANTEYIWQLPKGLKCFTLQVRDGTAIRIAMEKNKVASSNEPYFTLKASASWDEDDLDIHDPNSFFYFACSSIGKTVEIIVGIEEEG